MRSGVVGERDSRSGVTDKVEWTAWEVRTRRE